VGLKIVDWGFTGCRYPGAAQDDKETSGSFSTAGVLDIMRSGNLERATKDAK